MTQLDFVTAWSAGAAADSKRKADIAPDRPTIEQRWASWSVANAHVLDTLLRLAREHLDRGVTFLSVKRLWEECRVSLDAAREGGYRLNNDFTASAGRWLIEQEPRLEGVIRTRRTK